MTAQARQTENHDALPGHRMAEVRSEGGDLLGWACVCGLREAAVSCALDECDKRFRRGPRSRADYCSTNCRNAARAIAMRQDAADRQLSVCRRCMGSGCRKCRPGVA